MKALLGFGAIYFTIFLALFVVGAGAGFLLHWTLPAVNIGTGILIGVVTAAFAGHAFFTFLKAIDSLDDDIESDSESDTDDESDPTELRALSYVRPQRRRRKRK